MHALPLRSFRSASTAVRGLLLATVGPLVLPAAAQSVGAEVSVPVRLQDGEEFTVSLADLIEHGRIVFSANWTVQEGGGRPLTKGTGAPLSDPADPLVFPRDFNRVSAPDANSCAGCHNLPRAGGGGDFVANVFVLGQRFDFATFDANDTVPTKGAVDETGAPVELQSIANSRNTLGMFGSGYIEMLARQMTADLRAARDATPLGGSSPLVSKGVSFGTITHNGDDTWDVSEVEGLPAPSLATSLGNPPSLIVRPFHQAGAVVSLRQFSNNAFNHHHGIQATERFGTGTDPDGDGFVDEMSRAEVTAASVYQATLPVPGRVIPRDDAIEAAVMAGEDRFVDIGCAGCHVPCLPLVDEGWIFSEPNPLNPAGNLQPGGAVPSLLVDLNDKKALPKAVRPRLVEEDGVVHVPAFTDLKLHDIMGGPADPNAEPLDMNQPAGSAGFFAGNRKFLTRKLWGCANEPPFFHHGQFTTLRQSVLAHDGEALASRQAFEALPAADQDAIVEFLKTLQVLPAGTKHLVVDEKGKKRGWRDFPFDCSASGG